MARDGSPRPWWRAHRACWPSQGDDPGRLPGRARARRAAVADGGWFGDLTRALAGGGGGRRGFLRLLLGGAAGAALGAVAPRDTGAAPAEQAVCSPRPRVQITNTPTSTGLAVSVAATGAGNALQRITF